MTDLAKPKETRREASARGGRVTARESGAKAQALAAAHAAKRRLYEQTRAALPVPTGFRDAPEFLAALGEFCGAVFGRGVELATALGVSDSTLSKYFRGRKMPSAEKLQALGEWYRAKLAAPGVIRPAPRVIERRDPPAERSLLGAPSRQIGLGKLSPEVSERLRRTARLRNLAPSQFAEQILDRHLPKLHDL